jgi:hypothetical protein
MGGRPRTRLTASPVVVDADRARVPLRSGSVTRKDDLVTGCRVRQGHALPGSHEFVAQAKRPLRTALNWAECR